MGNQLNIQRLMECSCDSIKDGSVDRKLASRGPDHVSERMKEFVFYLARGHLYDVSVNNLCAVHVYAEVNVLVLQGNK